MNLMISFIGGAIVGCAATVTLSQYVPAVELQMVMKDSVKEDTSEEKTDTSEGAFSFKDPDTGEVMEFACPVKNCEGMSFHEEESEEAVTDEDVELYRPLLDAIGEANGAGYDSYTTPDGEFHQN